MDLLRNISKRFEGRDKQNMTCEGCYYNRSMTAWGETFEACHYSVENTEPLYGDDGCSGYDPLEKQLEIEL